MRTSGMTGGRTAMMFDRLIDAELDALREALA